MGPRKGNRMSGSGDPSHQSQLHRRKQSKSALAGASPTLAAAVTAASKSRPKIFRWTPPWVFKLYNEITSLTIPRLLFDQSLIKPVAFVLILLEVFINIFIINRVRYTEIDWATYMKQVECFLNGTLDYGAIEGPTGPIVYPAGHLYIFTILYLLTSGGTNIFLAQHIYIVLYILMLVICFRIYIKCLKVPPYALVFMCLTSYRIHSIFVLRLFNDPIAMLFLYGCINMALDNRWRLASTFFSLAVSIKMNVLLFAPAYLLILLQSIGFIQTIINLAICGTVQVLLGLPFLIANPVNYIVSSFNLGRVFLYKWTVNWRFLPEPIFVDRRFHLLLLGCHLLVLMVYLIARIKIRRAHKGPISFDEMVVTMFGCNFIGMTFARSLHYQFYVWYFHSLPYLLWSTSYKPVTKLFLLGLIELCWNRYPSTIWSSGLLHFCHLVLLIGLFKASFTKSGSSPSLSPSPTSSTTTMTAAAATTTTTTTTAPTAPKSSSKRHSKKKNS